MFGSGSLGFMASVRPLAGAGIEMLLANLAMENRNVRPLAGAGIEIF